MPRYIDAEELVKDIKSRFCADCNAGSGTMKCIICPTHDTIREIIGAPTIVEVVRCEKCDYREECNKEVYLEGSYTSLTYCSEGEIHNVNK